MASLAQQTRAALAGPRQALRARGELRGFAWPSTPLHAASQWDCWAACMAWHGWMHAWACLPACIMPGQAPSLLTHMRMHAPPPYAPMRASHGLVSWRPSGRQGHSINPPPPPQYTTTTTATTTHRRGPPPLVQVPVCGQRRS